MPHPRILAALGMTAREWGLIPVEAHSTERDDLKKEAMRRINLEDAKIANGSVHARLSGIEARLNVLEKPQPHNPQPPADSRALHGLEERLHALETKSADKGKSELDLITALESRVKALEKPDKKGG